MNLKSHEVTPLEQIPVRLGYFSPAIRFKSR
jgi:hypothetical protein